jgi:ABC-type multidrug transport system ATPase subunit
MRSSKICRKKLDKQCAAVIKNVTKIYDGADTSKPYVKNVSMSFRRDEIFCILGRNGAGKSTIMKMLSGQIEPTDGDVFLPLNYDVISGIKNPNEQIGICTQNNVLIPNLTVFEHLELYANMKMSNKISKEIRRVLQETRLDAYKNYKSSALSGGYQRRLCIAIAFLGSPDLVILDEPCNGIDLDASKSIWTMITKFKSNRAVFIATHNLEEVQFLADRIAILKDGISVFESQMESLREDLSASFNISVETIQTEFAENVFKSNAISYQISENEDKKKILNAIVKRKVEKDNLTLIQELEQLQDKNQISGFRVSNKTLNELFESVDTANQHMENNNNINNDSKSSEKMNNHKSLTFIQSSMESQRDEKFKIERTNESVTRQFKMLMWKRFKHFTRNYKLILNILVLPVIFEIIAIIFMKIRPPGNHDNALTFNRSLYPNSVEFYSYENQNNFSDRVFGDFEDACQTQGETCEFFGSSKDTFDWFLKTHEEHIGKRYGGVSINDSKFVVWYNNKGYHSMPLYLNLLHNTILREEIDNPDYNIKTINHPLRLDTKELSISSL